LYLTSKFYDNLKTNIISSNYRPIRSNVSIKDLTSNCENKICLRSSKSQLRVKSRLRQLLNLLVRTLTTK